MVSYKRYLDIEIFEGQISRHQYPWHFHNCYTIVMVEKGSVIYEFQHNTIRVDEAEVLVLEPLQVHRNLISQLTRYKAIFVPKEYFECEGQSKITTQIVTQSNVVDGIMDLLHRIEIKCSKNEIKDSASKIGELIGRVQGEKMNDASANTALISKISYASTIKELAEEAHLSKFHFQRKFKKIHGLTIGQLKQQEKTTRAKMLLENGKLSTEVAYELGFFDQSHFIKYFKKMWAISPKNLK